MKTAVITLAIGKEFQELLSQTRTNLELYALNINADFKVIEKQLISKTTPHWEKFQLYDFLSVYDRIIYLDCDILIRPDADNLFDVVPETHLGLFNEAPFVADRAYAVEKGSDDYEMKDFTWDGKYFNTGVIVASKSHRYLFRPPSKQIFNFYEQTYINLQIQRNRPPIHTLHYKYNRMCCMDSATGEPRHASQVIHYAGIKPIQTVIDIIKKDNEILKETPKDKNFKKLIWISVEGGLGDQIQAEPTVRFLKKLHPDDDIRITTHYPEIFSHLNLPVAKHTELIWKDVDTQPFKRITLPNPSMPLWVHLSNMLCHTVDFCAISVLKRILPTKDKTYILKYSEEAKNAVLEHLKNIDIHKSILIHCGIHWDNKSFPKEYWESIIDGLLKEGITPILIGKDDGDRGVVSMPTKKGVIDLVNLLSLEELFAITDLVPALLSNDSAPIHIAGAFDNHIYLIPTCKHPDHLLPWRHRDMKYKTHCLYKRLMSEDIQSSPLTIYEVLGDKLTGPWEDYLLEFEKVVERISRQF